MSEFMNDFDSKRIKSIVFDQGADLCGIAPQDRFSEAPKGFSPTDIYDKCKSVIVFAKRLPLGSGRLQNSVPYTFVNHMITEKVNNLTFNLCLYLTAVPTLKFRGHITYILSLSYEQKSS